MTACIMAGSFTSGPLVYPALRKIMLPMKDLSGGEIRGVQEPSSVSALHHHQAYEVRGSPIDEFVGTRTPPNRVYRRRIPPEIFDALPESAVDPPTSGDDDHEGVNFGLSSKGDHWRHGDGKSLSPVSKPSSSPTYGRTITVTGSPIKKSEKTYFGEQDLWSTRAGKDPDKNQHLGASDVRSSSPNSASQILRCQQCLGGTVFGVYQTPTASRKSDQTTSSSSKEALRKTTVPSSPTSTATHSTSSQVPFDQRRRESVPERRYRPVYYSDPRYRHRFERFNYGYSDTHSRPSSKEIAVSGLQEFCRTMLTVKNCPVDYHHQEKHVTHSSMDSSQANDYVERRYHSYDGTSSQKRDVRNVKHAGQEKNESLQQNRRRDELRKQEKVEPSPTLRSPKLVKEILKRMSSQPSGQIPHSEVDSYSDDDENFLQAENGSRNPDPEAMRIMDEFDKTLGVEDKSLDYRFAETVRSRNESASQPKSENTKKAMTTKEQESQSDNLIEELVLSGHKLKQRPEESRVVSPGMSNKEDAEVTTPCAKTEISPKQETLKRVDSPAPQKPPRNYDSLPRGLKQSSGAETSFDHVSSGVHPLSAGSLDVAVQPNCSSVDSGVCSPQQNYFVVVAIDFGTTYSGYAFSFTRDPENIHMMREGGDRGSGSQKTPTTLLLTPDEKFHSFGYAARDFYHDLDQEEAKKWLYFEKFKMTLHMTENLNRDTSIAAANGRSLPAVTVFAHALRYFKDNTLQDLSDQLATPILSEDIRWVVTVPAIWRQPAKQFMRSAAYEAGIASPDVPEQLMIALEPEAASIFCRRLQTHQLVPSLTSPQRLSLPNTKENTETSEPAVIENTGTRYMVVDCGGGTVDITVHEIVDDRGTIKELHKATGGPHGSVGIDMEFEKLLNEIFGADFMEQFKIKKPAGFVELMIAFEARKRNATTFQITPLNISLPFSLIDHYKKTKGSSVENAIKKCGNKEIKWTSQGMLRLEPTCMQRLFQPTLDAIKQHISAVLNHPQVKNLEYLFLVGGFSESQILQKSIRDTFSPQLKVIIPQGVSLAILKGAVQFGLDPTIVTARRSRLTYGVGVLNRFVHGFHPKEKLVVKDGVEWCADIFDKFVVSDQSVCVGDMVIRKYTPARVGQACSVIHIYCSEKEDVNFITDPGVQRCGTLILDLSNCNASDSSSLGRREIETVMVFGDTELKVSAVDVSTGKCVKAEVDFFNQ